MLANSFLSTMNDATQQVIPHINTWGTPHTKRWTSTNIELFEFNQTDS